MPKPTPKTRRAQGTKKVAVPKVKQKAAVPKAKPAKRSSTASKPANAKPRKSAAAKAAESFVRGVLVRGEAAKPSKQGKLPPGATHEIVAESGSGLPKLRRRRFSLA